VRKLYKQHIAFMLGRANTVSRQFYQADPTIYGFDILNEPRYGRACICSAMICARMRMRARTRVCACVYV
jgi:hypothetical protein